MINKVIDYFKEEDYSLLITNNKIYIENYIEISYVSNNIINIKVTNNIISINGENLVINKLLDKEVMIIGIIKGITISE